MSRYHPVGRRGWDVAKTLGRAPGRMAHMFTRVLFRPAIMSRLPRSAGDAVCLSLDDGPHVRNTERILRILHHEDVRASFFVNGIACERYPELVRAIVAQGHEVANHGYAHVSPDEVTFAEYVADVEYGQRLLEDAVGHRLARIFRPPYGRVAPRTFVSLWRRGYHFVLWDSDSRDSYVSDADDVVANVVASPLRAGSIVLLHEDYEWTVDALPRVISHIRSMDLQFATLSSAPAPSGHAGYEIDVSREERCA